ncbi:MAG: molybdenum cofactor guanylyltransferase [Chloroflexota bacterium]
MTGVVLAGGRSRRLGRDKAFEGLGGESLLERAVRSLAGLAGVVVVVGQKSAPAPDVRRLGARVVEDIYPGKGPLGGIHSGLVASTTPYVLVVGCDMPFLNRGLLGYLLGLRSGFDAVVPRVSGKPEPLHAVYSKACLPVVERQLREDKPAVHVLLEELRVRYVEQDKVERFDPQHLSFFNVNSAADMEKARELVRRQQAVA